MLLQKKLWQISRIALKTTDKNHCVEELAFAAVLIRCPAAITDERRKTSMPQTTSLRGVFPVVPTIFNAGQ
jgi:hypothetical protein